ncbi:R,R-butanediol dehydrogenase [Coprinopsis cinerea okayama7|uniref:R,R-butanediol dehydrogenase n=1 Tax=Coprinopsis cinerea (strain Okayama-7 / 130 / ATCC MYA-4618 / FGSC 9003) TaxID=240176 RepID=D6RNU8_COPC7|nr:R,R-butanediol dehydrogenase [Coprinopsis cinerea okayama7\|eukprot:XP_002910844.1 R,R-butanediol dehydrogenase [Coprinopsis cinerea okayama7\
MQAAANAAQNYMGPLPTDVHPEYEPAESGEKMRALAWFGTKDVRMIDAPIPKVTEPDDVILKVTATTICGSDLHLYHGEIMALQKGEILGHEFMGVVDSVGPSVKNLEPGQRVVASFQIACGECEFCKKKISSMCDRTNPSSLQKAMYGTTDAGFFGYSHFAGGFPGGQAEYVRVPKGNVNLLPVPDDLADEQVLFLSDILPTSYHAVVDTGVEEGDTVAVWGLGPVGMYVAKFALLKGASKVIGIDQVPERLEFAEQSLGIETINFKEHKDVPARIREIIGEKGVDVCIDAGSFHEPKSFTHKVQKFLMLETDAPETINEMLLAVRKMGRCGIIAVYAGYANGVNVGALMEKGIRLIGNGQAPVHLYWKDILENYIKTGKLDPTFIISHRVGLEDLPALYAAFDARTAGVEKVVVDTKFTKALGRRSDNVPPLTRVQDWKNDPEKSSISVN